MKKAPPATSRRGRNMKPSYTYCSVVNAIFFCSTFCYGDLGVCLRTVIVSRNPQNSL